MKPLLGSILEVTVFSVALLLLLSLCPLPVLLNGSSKLPLNAFLLLKFDLVLSFKGDKSYIIPCTIVVLGCCVGKGRAVVVRRFACCALRINVLLDCSSILG